MKSVIFNCCPQLTHFLLFLFQVVRPGEPVYAQVNRDKKKSSRGMGGPSDHPMGLYHGANGGGAGDYSEHADHWRVMQQQQQAGGAPQQVQVDSAGVPQPASSAQGQAGDSWV